MTSKLKCPICGGDIQYNDGYSTYDCKNNPANHNASEEIWQALIQSQQDLEESQQATLENAQTVLEIHKDLENAKADIEDYKKHKALWEEIRNNTILELERKLGIARKAMNQVMSMGAKNNICYHLKAKTVKSILGKALEQIEHKE